jgi:WhiB family transcriptional regulator, redox-sensing transcriptional regulator
MAEISRLPVTAESAWEWQYSGACRDAEPSLFFHPEGERGPARRKRDTQAVAVCAQCPVIERCRQHAFSVREPFGVWGGLTEHDREAMQQRFSTLRVVDPDGNCMAMDPIPAIQMPLGS